MEETLLFDQTIKKMKLLFRVSGFNITSGKRTTSNYLKSRLMYLLNFLALNTGSAGAIYWFIDGVQTGKDFFDLTAIAPCISLANLSNFKTIFLILNEKYVFDLMDKLRKLEMQEKRKTLSEKKSEIVEQERKFLHGILDKFQILYVTVIVTFAINPLVLMGLKYHQTGEVELMLPFLVRYPFDSFQIKRWPFVFLHHIWIETATAMGICAADCFFITCCSYIRLQFRLLSHDLENIIPIEVNSNEQYIENDEFKNNFKMLIRWHQDVIELVDFLEKIYSRSTLFNFLTSSLIICLTGFNVTMVNDKVFVITFTTFLLLSLVQIFFLCFFADLLMVSSTEISDAVYNSKWYMAEPKIGKNLLIVLIRSQKPCKLTACGYADVNLNAFMRVLSTAWSYFALLQTMYGN